jgi:hypothetical protein
MSKSRASNEATSSNSQSPTYGSIRPLDLDKTLSQYRSDTRINYEIQDEIRRVCDEDDNDDSKTSIVIAHTCCCKSSYVMEPVAFIQNLAASIMNFSLGLFIYNRIFTRLLGQNQSNKTNGTNFSFHYTTNNFHLNQMPLTLLNTNTHPLLSYSFNNSISNNCIGDNSSTKNFSYMLPFSVLGLTPSEIDAIRVKAQEETSLLYFHCSLISAIPVLVMSNILGVNCSNLGRKTLVVIYLFVVACRYILVLFQCIYPDWPDWLFYVGAALEGLGGGSGCFYLALYCFISDLASESSRSFRITFVNNLNSFATLSVTFVCGYVIKYYGYFYLFLASVSLILISLLYTVFFILEPLVELRSKSLWKRVKSCSVKRSLNCFKVYFNKKDEVNGEESQSLLNSHTAALRPRKQTFILLLIVFANFIFCFGSIGVGSIFNLYLMNKPFCFDSIEISNYTIFSTLSSLVISLLVSRFVKVSDLLVCIISIGSYFISVFCYIYGDSIGYIYLGLKFD